MKVRKSGLPVTVSLVSASPPPGDKDLIHGWARKQLLLNVLCQHSCLHGLVLNRLTVTFSLPGCVVFQADQSSAGVRCVTGLTSVLTQPCG